MIIPDVNVLLYAHIDGFAQHLRAVGWWQRTLSGSERVGLAPVVVTGFVRLATSSRVLERPMPVDAAVGVVNSWTERRNVQVLTSDGQHLAATLGLLAHIGAAAILTTDAQIAAHALHHGATVATNDADFARFAGVRTLNPIAST